ncbi:MAG: hypothetical protein ACI9DC_005642 [Gammaproteobacteria bacterium]|jgi:hypothetical protein
MIQLFVLNLALAFVVGFIGRKRRLGFWGHYHKSGDGSAANHRTSHVKSRQPITSSNRLHYHALR